MMGNILDAAEVLLLPIAMICTMVMIHIMSLRLRAVEEQVRVTRELVSLRKNERVVYEEEES